jgi:hypothetical protein
MLDNEQGQPQDNNSNFHSSESLSSMEDNAYRKRELADETIEQEAEVSNHTNAADIDVEDPTEPAPAGQPKSIANDESHF